MVASEPSEVGPPLHILTFGLRSVTVPIGFALSLGIAEFGSDATVRLHLFKTVWLEAECLVASWCWWR